MGTTITREQRDMERQARNVQRRVSHLRQQVAGAQGVDGAAVNAATLERIDAELSRLEARSAAFESRLREMAAREAAPQVATEKTGAAVSRPGRGVEKLDDDQWAQRVNELTANAEAIKAGVQARVRKQGRAASGDIHVVTVDELTQRATDGDPDTPYNLAPCIEASGDYA